MRACNQEGTDEAEQATRDREDLNKWSSRSILILKSYQTHATQTSIVLKAHKLARNSSRIWMVAKRTVYQHVRVCRAMVLSLPWKTPTSKVIDLGDRTASHHLTTTMLVLRMARAAVGASVEDAEAGLLVEILLVEVARVARKSATICLSLL